MGSCEMLTLKNLHGYQKRFIRFILERKKVCGFIDMGMGKTVSTLTAVNHLLETKQIKKILIVAPLRVAACVWDGEAKEWEHLQHLEFSKAAVPGVANREHALKSDKPIHIINVDNVQWLVGYLGKSGFDYDCLVIDELSQFKNSSSKRWKELKKTLPRFKYVIGLTGTPCPNSLLELWSQLFLIDKGERLGKSFYQFKQHYFTPDYMGYNHTIKPGSEIEIQNKIKDICLSMSAADYLELPPVIFNNVLVELPQSARKAYDKLKKDLIVEIQGIQVNPANAAVLVGKLQQIAQGFAYSETETIQIHTAKLDALEEIMNEAGSNVLLFYKFKRDAEAIKKAFPESVNVSEPGAIENWNNGKIRLLIGHPLSCSHGLNLQHGGNVIVWYGLTHSLEQTLQSNARLDRQGQTKTVIIHRIIASTTVDTAIIDVLEKRQTIQNALLSALK